MIFKDTYLMKWFIDKYGVCANLDKLFIKKLFDIKLFLEQIKPKLNPLDIVIPECMTLLKYKYQHQITYKIMNVVNGMNVCL
ncbi:hypothetical protein U3516DRAFT_735554 [Neocallimastix sp. 'constans']